MLLPFLVVLFSLALGETEVQTYTENGREYMNVIYRGRPLALASNTYKDSSPSLAIDGRFNGKLGFGSVYQSQWDRNNKWAVMLHGAEGGVKYPVHMVTIWPRTDCCTHKINHAKVWVDDVMCGEVQLHNYPTPYQKLDIKCPKDADGGVVTIQQDNNRLELTEVQVWVQRDKIPDIPIYLNVALNKPARQSRTYKDAEAGRAVDGDRSKWFPGGSCTLNHAKNKEDRWWMVNLQSNYSITNILIHNRLDFSSRINGAKVFVVKGTEEQLCGTVNYKESDIPLYNLHCNLEGDKVLVKAGDKELTLCEVEVFGVGSINMGGISNVAPDGIAKANNMAKRKFPHRAIDGSTRALLNWRSVYQSEWLKDNRWVVLLKGSVVGVRYPIKMVTIWPRKYTGSHLINGAKVYVDNALCGQVQYQLGNPYHSVDIMCPTGSLGGIVTVEQNKNILELAEVQVWVPTDKMPEIPKYKNVAYKKPTTQTKTFQYAVADRAVDGNIDPWMSGKSCACTNARTRETKWWSVDLQGTFNIKNIVIHNRIDHDLSYKIDGAKVYVENGEEKELCATIHYKKTDISVYYLNCNLTGDHVRISAEVDRLSLCEVQVFVLEENTDV